MKRPKQLGEDFALRHITSERGEEMLNEQDRIHEIHALTLQAWKWYKEKSQIIPSKRDDYFWNTVKDDIQNMTKKEKIENVNCRNFLRDIMMAYMNELQGEYCEWVSTRQERLPI